MGKPWIICMALQAGRPRVICCLGIWFLFINIWCDSLVVGSTSLKVCTYTGQQKYSKTTNVLACMFQVGIEVALPVFFFDHKTTVHFSATVTGQKTYSWRVFHTRCICRHSVVISHFKHRFPEILDLRFLLYVSNRRDIVCLLCLWVHYKWRFYSVTHRKLHFTFRRS
jgi:hypothetical protein